MSKTVKGIIAFIVIVAIALVLFLVLTANPDLKIINGDITFTADSDNVFAVQSGQAYVFYCNTDRIDASIIPSPGVDFDIIVNGEYNGFAAVKKFTEGFKIEKTATGCILFLPQDLTMDSILEKHFGGYEQTIPANMSLSDNFALKVVLDGTTEVVITLNFGD